MAARAERGRAVLRVAAALALAVAGNAGAGETRPGAPRLLLLRSSTTAAHFAAMPGATPGAYDATVDGWERRLQATGFPVERIDDARLAALAAAEGARSPRPVVVAPSAAALEDAAVERLLAAVARGVGLVASWQFAVRGPRGAWRGLAPLASLVGAAPLGDATSPEPTLLRWVTLHGGHAVTAGLPAGARLQIQPFDTPLPLVSPAAVADFTRWELLPFGEAERPLRPTAVAQARYGAGRVVWINFEPRALVPEGEGPAWLERLIENAVTWTAGLPLVEPETWPGGARFAAMVGLDTEQDFAVGAHVARRFLEAGVPLTAFAVSSLAVAHPEVVRALAGAGEVGSHTDDHRPLAGRPPAEQREQLVRSRDILAGLAGTAVIGFRPPEEQVDDVTFEAAVAAGYTYVAGTPDKDRAVPTLRRVRGRPLVVLPRIPFDDYEFTVRSAASDPAAVARTVRRDLEQLRRLGGLWFFDFHTQYANAPVLAGALEEVLGVREAADAWRATGRDIAAWWLARSGATAGIRLERRGDAAVLRVAAGAQRVERLGLRVHLPPGSDPTVRWRAPGDVRLDATAPETLRVEIPVLEPRERRRLVLRPATPPPGG